MYFIKKRLCTIAYCHRLHKMPTGHKCSNIHGHNGVVWVKIESEQLQNDMLFDFGKLKTLSEKIKKQYDHIAIQSYDDKLLLENQVVTTITGQVTAENLAVKIWYMARKFLPNTLCPYILTIEVQESDSNIAGYTNMVK